MPDRTERNRKTNFQRFRFRRAFCNFHILRSGMLSIQPFPLRQQLVILKAADRPAAKDVVLDKVDHPVLGAELLFHIGPRPVEPHQTPPRATGDPLAHNSRMRPLEAGHIIQVAIIEERLEQVVRTIRIIKFHMR